ncbi:MAG: response regulator [Deltaproteobacteria bacterium]|nr:response regulator [Deltaproteobacteria bacterium]
MNGMTHSDKKYPKKILIIDDEELNRIPLTILLEEAGYEVFESERGEDAISFIKKESVDLILLDVVMPGMNGFQVCESIRRDIGALTLPVIFVTALEDRDSRVKGIDSGGDDFLTKPVDPVELLARVKNLLRVKDYHDLKDRQKENLEIELESARSQLIHADRLATLGTLAGGVGHELQNVYGVFSGALMFIKENAKKGIPPDEEDLENLETVAKHLKLHSSQLLTMARPGPEYEGVVDLRDVFTRTLVMLKISGKTKNVDVNLDLPEKSVSVRVNKTRIEQVVINIIGNSVDAILSLTQGERIIWVKVNEITAMDRVVCTIENNGPHIPLDKLDKIFEPYFTTKDQKGGTGLGLSVVRNIISSYDGTVFAENIIDGGGKFIFDLPVVKE